MSVAFEGIDRLVVTFLAGDVTAGKPVVMGGEGSVKNASSGQMPVGVALHAQDGHAAVQLKGFVTVQYSGSAYELTAIIFRRDRKTGSDFYQAESSFTAMILPQMPPRVVLISSQFVPVLPPMASS